MTERAPRGPVSAAVVDFDPALAADLDECERMAAEVHVLRGRAEGLRGPRRGDRALLLELRASELEEQLLRRLGVDRAGEVTRRMATHPATRAAIERWQYAQQLADRLLAGQEVLRQQPQLGN